jgi:hypothetical protein
MEIQKNNEGLQKAFSGKPKETEISKEEEIGIHKGSLNTLLSERNELIKMIANVEAIIQAHIARLKELGINLTVQK